METAKVLVKEGDMANIFCPFCQKMKKVSVAQYRDKGKRNLQIKCSCKNIFFIGLEFRKYPRKPVELLGRSINLSQHKESQDIIIRNISFGGIGFNPHRKNYIQKDDRLQVSFGLKDTRNTFLDTDVIVRGSNQNYVSCEFQNVDSFRSSLGFFLLG